MVCVVDGGNRQAGAKTSMSIMQKPKENDSYRTGEKRQGGNIQTVFGAMEGCKWLCVELGKRVWLLFLLLLLPFFN